MVYPKTKNIFQKTRDIFWHYPHILFEKKGIIRQCFKTYKVIRPFSHIIVFLVLLIFIGTTNYARTDAFLTIQKKSMIEGVIVGDSGLSKINPLLPTNNQIENDLTRLIYHGLVRVTSSGEVQGVLAARWEQVDSDGQEYIFHLRDNVYWHDKKKFTADDVIATFDTLKALGSTSVEVSSKYSEVAQQMDLERIDDYTVRFKSLKANPTFFEDIDYGILPAHVLKDVSISTFSWAKFNLNPIGTGPFIFHNYKENVITLIANDAYFLGKPKINELKIILFETGDDAVNALKNGEIHSLADPSSAILKDLSNENFLQVYKSNTLYRRYWGLYFNLKKDGPEVFQDRSVRQAISSGISREAIINNIASAGEEAMGPIPVNSWAYDKDAKRYRYKPSRAKKLLTDNGWKMKKIEGKKVREKDMEILRFELSYLDKYDRQIIAESIKNDLESIGIIVNLDPRTSSDLNEALIATRNFEAVLYGVETPIDPDRIRLWHSKAIPYPGLNISSYATQETAAVIGTDKKIERISLIDAALENARTTLDRKKRTGEGGLSIGYEKFQEILLEDTPVVFLYHPVFSYVARKRVTGIDLSDMASPEDRYNSILNWRIE
jgi:peptide/nickel transport system substrate-binding protein